MDYASFRFNMQKSSHATHQISKLKRKNMIIAVNEEKALEKFHSHLWKNFSHWLENKENPLIW